MTLALYGKSKRRQGSLLLLGVFAVFVALVAGMSVYRSEDAKAVAQDVVLAGTFTFNVGGDNDDDNVAVITPWVDSDGSGGSDAAIRDDRVRLRSGQYIQIDVNATGYEGVRIEYDWGQDTDNDSSSDDGDLKVEWRLEGAGAWTTARTHNLSNNASLSMAAAADLDLPAGADNAQIEIRFWGDTDEDNDEAYVDNVRISADAISLPDADGDDVSDVNDLCPNTLTDAPGVNAQGCDWAQQLAPTVVTNPARPDTCNLDFALVLDRSASFTSGQLTTEATAAKNFIDSVFGQPNVTPTFRVAGFADNALTPSVGGIGPHATATAAKDAVDSVGSGTYTNWGAGITAGYAAGVDWMIVITDGNPNRPGSGSDVSLGALQAAVTAANTVKSAPAHITVIGVDTSGSPPAGFGPISQSYAALVGGPDVITLSDISSLDSTLAAISAACAPVIHVPAVFKEAANPGYSDGYAHWLIKVNNAANSEAVQVKINDSGVENDGAVNNGSCSDGDISDGEMICTANAGTHFVVPVKRAVSQQCLADTAVNSGTVSWMAPGSTEYTLLGSVGPVEITIPANPDLCEPETVDLTLKVCKYIDAASGDTSESFTITVTDKTNFTPSITQGGEAGISCTTYTYTVPSNDPTKAVTINETEPSGWNQPKFTKQNGAGAPTSPVDLPAAGLDLLLGEDTCNATAQTQLIEQVVAEADCTVTLINKVDKGEIYIGKDDSQTSPANAVGGATFRLTLGALDLCVTDGVNPAVANPAVPECAAATWVPDMAPGTVGTAKVTGLMLGTWLVTEVLEPVGFGPDTCNGERIAPLSATQKSWSIAGPGCTEASPGWTAFHNLPLAKNVTFQKYICNSLGDVARNEEAGGVDQVGMPSISALGGLSDELKQQDGPSGADDEVNPSNDGRTEANCHLWGTEAGETGTWDVEIYDSGHSSLLQTVNIPQGGTISVPLAGSVLAEALKADSSGARVEEVFKTGYGFASLKCYTDHKNQDNWEWLDFNPGGIPEGEVFCIAYNVPADKEIVIEKRFLGDVVWGPDDIPEFTFADPSIDPVCKAVLNSLDDHVYIVCTVPYDWNGTVTETPPDGWEQVECESRTTGDQQIQAIVDAQPYEVFCNQPVGTVVIVKYENVPPATTQTWNFNGSLPGAPVALQTTGTTNATGTASLTLTNVPAGSYTLAELQGQGVCESGDTSSDYQTRGLVQVGGSLPGTGAVNAAPIIGANDQTVTVQKGTTTYVVFGNQGCGSVLSAANLQVFKYSDPAANFTGTTELAGWTISITGTAGAANGQNFSEDTVLGNGAFFGGIPDGTYTVCETPKANWVVVGSKYNAVNQAGVCRTGVVVALDQTVVVNFYNQPRVNIEVNKTEISLATPAGAPGNGWSFTLNGCTVGPLVQVTGANGKATFSNLPPAVGCSYTVTETVKGGWSAINPVQVAAPAAAGQTSVLNFTNVKIEVCTDCRTTTPTATPETPTATPTPETPTATPTEEPTEEPAEEPTEATAGEKTPGPQTPIAPSTGTGFTGGGPGGMNMLFALVGLLAISLGTTILALGRKSSRR